MTQLSPLLFATAPVPAGGETFSVPGAPVGEAISSDPAAAPGGTGTPPGAGGNNSFFIIMLGLMAFMILMTVFSGRKQKKERAALLSNIKKGDRIMTTGGIIGTISELRDDEMVLKVDESSNTRIRFSRSSIGSVLKSGRDDTSTAAEDDSE